MGSKADGIFRELREALQNAGHKLEAVPRVTRRQGDQAKKDREEAQNLDNTPFRADDPRGSNSKPFDPSTQNKGEFGEGQVDELLRSANYERLDTPKHVNANGIDGVYRSPEGKIVIVESKYGSSRLGKTIYGDIQMSENWLLGREGNTSRIYDMFKGDPALLAEVMDAVDSRDFASVLAKIDASGQVRFDLLNHLGEVL